MRLSSGRKRMSDRVLTDAELDAIHSECRSCGQFFYDAKNERKCPFCGSRSVRRTARVRKGKLSNVPAEKSGSLVQRRWSERAKKTKIKERERRIENSLRKP